MPLRSSIEVSLPGTVLRNEGLVLGLRTEIVPCAISATYSKTISARVLASIELQSSATAHFNLGIPWVGRERLACTSRCTSTERNKANNSPLVLVHVLLHADLPSWEHGN